LLYLTLKNYLNGGEKSFTYEKKKQKSKKNKRNQGSHSSLSTATWVCNSFCICHLAALIAWHEDIRQGAVGFAIGIGIGSGSGSCRYSQLFILIWPGSTSANPGESENADSAPKARCTIDGGNISHSVALRNICAYKREFLCIFPTMTTCRHSPSVVFGQIGNQIPPAPFFSIFNFFPAARIWCWLKNCHVIDL